MKFKPGQRVIFTKRGESRHYDTDWPATYVKTTPTGRHSIRLDGIKRLRIVRERNLRPEKPKRGYLTECDMHEDESF